MTFLKNKRSSLSLILSKYFQRCLWCAEPEVDDFFCYKCREKLPGLSKGYCKSCGLAYYFPSQHFCLDCLQNPPLWSNFAFGCYLEGIFKKMVYEYKFKKNFAYLDFFTLLLENAFYRHRLENPEIILPVPLHNSGLRQRGFNQSLELAKKLSKRIGGLVLPKALIKVKNILPQRSLGKKQRLLNVRNAFSINYSLAGKKVLLIDDIYTTGATLREIANLLRKKEVAKVEVLVLARSI